MTNRCAGLRCDLTSNFHICACGTVYSIDGHFHAAWPGSGAHHGPLAGGCRDPVKPINGCSIRAVLSRGGYALVKSRLLATGEVQIHVGLTVRMKDGIVLQCEGVSIEDHSDEAGRTALKSLFSPSRIPATKNCFLVGDRPHPA